MVDLSQLVRDGQLVSRSDMMKAGQSCSELFSWSCPLNLTCHLHFQISGIKFDLIGIRLDLIAGT